MTEPELPAVPDIPAMLAALERARAMLSPEDHALLSHKGTSIMVASQDPPSVPLPLIEFSSQIILHKFNSRAWLRHIQKGERCARRKRWRTFAGGSVHLVKQSNGLRQILSALTKFSVTMPLEAVRALDLFDGCDLIEYSFQRLG